MYYFDIWATNKNTINGPPSFAFLFLIWFVSWCKFLSFNLVYDLIYICYMLGIQKWQKKCDHGWKCLIKFFLLLYMHSIQKTGIPETWLISSKKMTFHIKKIHINFSQFCTHLGMIEKYWYVVGMWLFC